MRKRRAEIATILTVGTLIVIGLTALVSSFTIKNKQTTSSKAAECGAEGKSCFDGSDCCSGKCSGASQYGAGTCTKATTVSPSVNSCAKEDESYTYTNSCCSGLTPSNGKCITPKSTCSDEGGSSPCCEGYQVCASDNKCHASCSSCIKEGGTYTYGDGCCKGLNTCGDGKCHATCPSTSPPPTSGGTDPISQSKCATSAYKYGCCVIDTYGCSGDTKRARWYGCTGQPCENTKIKNTMYGGSGHLEVCPNPLVEATCVSPTPASKGDNGATCSKNEQCTSNYCNLNAYPNVCAEVVKKSTGSSCNNNEDCLSGYCPIVSGYSSGRTCAEPATTTKCTSHNCMDYCKDSGKVLKTGSVDYTFDTTKTSDGNIHYWVTNSNCLQPAAVSCDCTTTQTATFCDSGTPFGCQTKCGSSANTGSYYIDNGSFYYRADSTKNCTSVGTNADDLCKSEFCGGSPASSSTAPETGTTTVTTGQCLPTTCGAACGTINKIVDQKLDSSTVLHLQNGNIYYTPDCSGGGTPLTQGDSWCKCVDKNYNLLGGVWGGPTYTQCRSIVKLLDERTCYLGSYRNGELVTISGGCDFNEEECVMYPNRTLCCERNSRK